LKCNVLLRAETNYCNVIRAVLISKHYKFRGRKYESNALHRERSRNALLCKLYPRSHLFRNRNASVDNDLIIRPHRPKAGEVTKALKNCAVRSFTNFRNSLH